MIIDDYPITDSNKLFTNLFLYLDNHLGITTFLLSQIDGSSKAKQTWAALNKNAHYFIILNNQRNRNFLISLGRQMGNYHFLKAVFDDITRTYGNYSYLFIGLHPCQPKELQYLSNICSEGGIPPAAYINLSDTTWVQKASVCLEQ